MCGYLSTIFLFYLLYIKLLAGPNKNEVIISYISLDIKPSNAIMN